MTLLATPRSRRLVLWATLLSLALVAFFIARRIASVHAAAQAIAQETLRVTTQPDPHSNATPVLVELFTSEGCSSCPPADALLAHLELQQPVPAANIIVLEEHVDYWEGQGWHDRFSSHQFTDRQNVYAQRLGVDDIYTPQMIVDGTRQFVGNDSALALRSITQAARTPKLALTFSPLGLEGDHITGQVSTTAGNLPSAGLYAAVIEPTASTDVRGGENGGRTLHHVSVVRSLVHIGSLQALGKGPIQFKLSTPKDPAASSLRLVVFAQRENQGAILGAAASTIVSPTAPPVSQQISMR